MSVYHSRLLKHDQFFRVLLEKQRCTNVLRPLASPTLLFVQSATIICHCFQMLQSAPSRSLHIQSTAKAFPPITTAYFSVFIHLPHLFAQRISKHREFSAQKAAEKTRKKMHKQILCMPAPTAFNMKRQYIIYNANHSKSSKFDLFSLPKLMVLFIANSLHKQLKTFAKHKNKVCLRKKSFRAHICMVICLCPRAAVN
jgi:hypothetical protein